MVAETPESDLIQQAVSGDKGALSLLLIRHQAALSTFIDKRLPLYARTGISPEDIRQITWEQAFGGVARFEQRGEGSFLAWLTGIANHRIQDALRQQQRARELFVPAAAGSSDGAAPEPPGDISTPSRIVAGEERLVLLRQALLQLPQDYRTVLELRYMQGLSVAETATRMQRGPGAICMLCSRALDEMHTIMGNTSKYLSANE